MRFDPWNVREPDTRVTPGDHPPLAGTRKERVPTAVVMKLLLFQIRPIQTAFRYYSCKD